MASRLVPARTGDSTKEEPGSEKKFKNKKKNRNTIKKQFKIFLSIFYFQKYVPNCF